MANLYIVGSRNIGVMIVKTDPPRVIEITWGEISAAAAQKEVSVDAFFDDIMKGAKAVFQADGSKADPPPADFSYAAEMNNDEFAVRRWRAGPIAQAVSSAGEDAGAGEFAARRWRSALDGIGGFSARRWRAMAEPGGVPDTGQFATRRWRAAGEAAGAPADPREFNGRRWRAAIEAEAGGDSADFASFRWRAAPSERQYTDASEFIVRRWRSLPLATPGEKFDSRRFQSAEEEKAAIETTDYLKGKWAAKPTAAEAADFEEFIARRWRALDGIESGGAMNNGLVPGGLDP